LPAIDQSLKNMCYVISLTIFEISERVRGLFLSTCPALQESAIKTLKKRIFRDRILKIRIASLHFYGSKGKRLIKTMKEPFFGEFVKNNSCRPCQELSVVLCNAWISQFLLKLCIFSGFYKNTNFLAVPEHWQKHKTVDNSSSRWVNHALQKAAESSGHGLQLLFMSCYVPYPFLGLKLHYCKMRVFAHNLQTFFAWCGLQKRIFLQFFLQILVGLKIYYKKNLNSSSISLKTTQLGSPIGFLIDW
jgi:hypothetical protein